MNNLHNIDLLFIVLPSSIQSAVKRLLSILKDNEKARIKNAKNEELFSIYQQLGPEIEMAMLAFNESDSTLYDSLSGKAVLIVDAPNMIIDQLRYQLQFRKI
jgi:hypothetical protein